MEKKEATVRKFVLNAERELRFELEKKDETVILKLKRGTAEIFGTELTTEIMYEFTYGAKVAVFTWQGCILELIGNTNIYIAEETPMIQYLNCHAALENLREAAKKEDKRGPVLMVVGPHNVGKATLCRLLLNYGVKLERKPMYVNLDVGKAQIGVPGTVGALLVERTSNIYDGFGQDAPWLFHFGHLDPASNPALYKLLVTRLAEVCLDKLEGMSKIVKFSGIIINTCGSCAKGEGYEALKLAAQAFKVDTILVLDKEKLRSDLVRDMPDLVNVVLLPKSGGVDDRTQAQRNEAINESVREYFYGSRAWASSTSKDCKVYKPRTLPMHPCSIEMKWSEAKVYRIEAPRPLPESCMPMGMTYDEKPTKLVAVTPGPGLLHHLFAVLFTNFPEDDVVHKAVAGFVCVTDVDVERRTLTILSPQCSLPKHVLLLSNIQFVD